ncbi:choline kinase [Streptococcus suis]|uniref:Cholinephosphate cytidylyltransferase/choline kinase n=1 Tax=Streptococcus suis TaxID=1307 RepID=A0A0A7P4Q8_STRSU|nr:NTP transferase domain-containing protein [Streptococcus suis]AJA01381.1 cholinephosphate cytidylyltransferase/choline kinase [Streptococcus suis]ATZ03965.1 choline kinase [Streptococcus suis]
MILKNAIILAAGLGRRTIPLNFETHKAFLEVNGEILIERLIVQLKEAGVSEIIIVIGYKKEQFRYLIDKYEVELIENDDFANSNTLYSLSLAESYLSNSYIIPCDIWCATNPFTSKKDDSSWYMIGDTSKSVTKLDNLSERLAVAFIEQSDSIWIKQRLRELANNPSQQMLAWEELLVTDGELAIPTFKNCEHFIQDINTFEDLIYLDAMSNHLRVEAIDIICTTFDIAPKEIKNVFALKKGMTNRSFMFECKDKSYIMRIPGEGTDKLINREQEAEVYRVIAGESISDELIYISPEKGYKITSFIDGARNCDSNNKSDVSLCMKKLRSFHERGLTTSHEFDLFGEIEFYESLRGNRESIYEDYQSVKNRVLTLKSYIQLNIEKKVLCHIDANPDNFLIFEKNNQTEVRLIDWEYAGMQDPDLDIAMFAIYSQYNREQIDFLIGAYFEEGCEERIRMKIYAYVATAGLLWSNWCEYKQQLGVEFGDYAQSQYDYAKEYSFIVSEYLSTFEDKDN